jgi:ATP-dependent helicase/nuclease subunit A
MTVHGAKGLEAPLVILADTTSMPDGKHDAKLLPMPESEVLVWGLSKTLDSSRLREAREAAAELRAAEYRRLLYVALTRAADALVVCGAETRQSKSGPPEGSWYQLVESALKGELVQGDAPGFEGTVGRWRPEAAGAAARTSAPPVAPAEVPSWLEQVAPPSPAAPRRIAPSQLDPDDEPLSPFAKRSPGALDPRVRGDLMHRLLQRLPDIAPGERKKSALNFLSGAAREVEEAAREKLAEEAIGVIGHPELRELFGPGSRAEIDVLAQISENGGEEIFGRIDRLAVTRESVLIADFKTGAPPSAGQDAPGNYVRQLAIYCSLLKRIYPGRAMRTLLVWTETGTIQEIAPERLDAALKTATRAVTRP